MEYRVGLPEQLRASAAALYDEAFRQKFEPIVKDPAQRVAILAEAICPEFAIVAIEADRLIGLVGFYEGGSSFTGGGTARGVITRLGWFKGLWALVLFSLFRKSPAPGTLRMDGIVVDSAMRGKGIGNELLDRLVKYARQRGWHQIRLDVVDSNPGARRLYERRGFVPIRTMSHPFLSRLMGFSVSTTMVKHLDRNTNTHA